MVYDSNEYTQSGNRNYPQPYQVYYRVAPTFGFDKSTPAKLVVDGTLVVNGSIAGKVLTNETGTVIISRNANTKINISHVESDGTIVNKVYSLKDINGKEISPIGKFKIFVNQPTWKSYITFVKNDGSGIEETIEQTYGKPIIFPDWASEEVSWYSATVGGKYVSLKTGDRILYEKVYAVIHKQSDLNVIVFETNGGTPISNYMVPTNSTFDPNIIFIPEKENAVFLGWYLDSSFTRPYIEQVITQDTTLYARWAENGIKTSIKTSVSKTNGKTSIVVTALVTDGNGTPLEGVLVNFSGSAGTWAQKTAVTNNKGEAVVEYTTGNSNALLDMTELLKAVENVSFIADYTQVTVESSCPFVYSFDGQNYHFEHEAIPFSVNKALMSTSYGTLRHLREHNGLYHVRIAEKHRLYMALNYTQSNTKMVRELLKSLQISLVTLILLKQKFYPRNLRITMAMTY